MHLYENFMRHVFEHGVQKTDRTGTGTRSWFGYQMRFDLGTGFPLITTKKLHLRSIIYELLWFLQGSSNIAYLRDNHVMRTASSDRSMACSGARGRRLTARRSIRFRTSCKRSGAIRIRGG